MSGRKHNPFLNEDDVWIDWWSPILGAESGFEDNSILRMDLHRAIINLPSMQRVAVLKWMRDEALTASERMNFTRAKRNLAKIVAKDMK